MPSPVETPDAIGHSAASVPTRLLIVDDDTELTRLLAELLGPEGFDVDTQSRGADAASRAGSGTYALVILDVMLPDLSGFEILKQIRRVSQVPVILLTARGADVDRIVGLEIGADDYVPKPFNPRELTARIRAVLRRGDARTPDRERRVLKVDDVALDPASRSVLRDGQTVDVTSVEFDVLRALLESAGHPVARATLVEKVLERPFNPFDRSIDMHISNLRKKLGPRLGGEERIKTVRGSGYIYTLPASEG